MSRSRGGHGCSATGKQHASQLERFRCVQSGAARRRASCSSDAATQCGTCKRMNSGSIGSLVSAPQSRYQPCAFALLRERRRGETAAQSGFSRWAEAEYRTNAGVAVQCAKQQGCHIFEPERRIARLPAILVFCGPAALGSSHRHRLLVAKQKSFVQFLSFHTT
jgi:hypothetical protein